MNKPFTIPKQLRKPQYRFYIVAQNQKIPIMKRWNTINNFQYNDSFLLSHLNAWGNYGIVCQNDLIVLDFDDLNFHNKIKPQLPETFTVQTASSRLFHYYYHLKGEPIRKIGINDDEDNRTLDIQANGAGIVAPGSRIGSNGYDVINDIEINSITLDQLKSIFHIDKARKARIRLFLDKTKSSKGKVRQSIKSLESAKIKRIKERHFQCPLHDMKGNGNLTVMDNGGIYCFHCQKYAKSGEEFIRKYTKRLIL